MKIINYLLSVFFVLTAFSCSNDILDLEPKDMLDVDDLFSTDEGVEVYMANLYYNLPVEDFAYFPTSWMGGGYNFNIGNCNNGGVSCAMLTDEAIHSEWAQALTDDYLTYWGYDYVRDINFLIKAAPSLDLSDEKKNEILAECRFLRAFAYFEMCKRYGGLPIIEEPQEWNGDVEALKVSRSTEQETWDFILAECDAAASGLPEENVASERRANKYVALALKSRAALYAASVAKYWNRAPMSGPAVTLGLVGIPESEAERYYTECIEASEAIMISGKYGLYKPDPANPEEAALNYRKLFEDPNIAADECIFIKGFTAPVDGQAHNYEIWYNPNQTANGWPHPGRCNPTLDLVNAYENYSNPGFSSPIVTTNNLGQFIRWDNTYDIFNGKDARLFATVILPGTKWKNKDIIIQAGYVQPNGLPVIETKASITVNDVTYYTYGASDWPLYSGFDTYGGNMTRSGFGFKKFLNEENDVTPEMNKSTNDWAEIRYAEVLLNYAEAVVESGYSEGEAQTKAALALNSTRRRAGHTVDIPLTLDNVLRERRVELAFENKRIWDLLRRREYHTLLSGTVKYALAPLLDLRVSPPKYIFVKKACRGQFTLSFQNYQYYRLIPGVAANGLIQNPLY